MSQKQAVIELIEENIKIKLYEELVPDLIIECGYKAEI